MTNSGQPSSVNVHICAVEEKIQREQAINCHITFPSFSTNFMFSSKNFMFHKFHVHKIVSEKMNYQKLCTLWVPKMFTEKHKMRQWVQFFDQFTDQGDDFLSSIVTGDKTQVSQSHATPKSKQQSTQWRHISLPTKKFKQMFFSWKVLLGQKRSFASGFLALRLRNQPDVYA